MSGLYYSAPCCCKDLDAVDCSAGCPSITLIHLTITDWEWMPGFDVNFMTLQLDKQVAFDCGWDGLDPVFVDGSCTFDGESTVCPVPGTQGVTCKCLHAGEFPNTSNVDVWFATISFGPFLAQGAKSTGDNPVGSYDEITGGFGSMTVSLPP